MEQVKYPSFENLHRVVSGRSKISLLNRCYLASEKVDGSNAGICISLEQQKVLWIQSRGRNSGPAPLVWSEDSDQSLLNASISGNVLAKNDPELFTKLVAVALHLAKMHSIGSRDITIFGEAKAGSFYPFAFGFLANFLGDHPKGSSTDSSDGTPEDSGLFGQLSFSLHDIFTEHRLTPPRLISTEPLDILQIVSMAEPDLIRKNGQAEFEGWFITRNIDELVIRSEVKGYKLKSTTHEEQPAVPFDISELSNEVGLYGAEADSSDESAAQLIVAEKLVTIFSQKGNGFVKVPKVKPVKPDEQLNQQIQFAFDSVMSKQIQSAAEIRAGDKSSIVATVKSLNPLLVEDVNSQFISVGATTPDEKMLSSMVTKFLSIKFFAPPKGP